MPAPVGSDEHPDYRFTPADERTLLAWLRTALALVAGGVPTRTRSAPSRPAPRCWRFRDADLGTGPPVRIGTFNILHGRFPGDGMVDLDRFASAVAHLDADVLGLQEVDRDQRRSHGADLTALAAEAMGARDHRFVAALAGTPGGSWTAATGAELPGSPGYGIALMSRYPVAAWRLIRLPPLRVAVPLWSMQTRRPFLARDEPRVAVAAVLDGPFGALTVCATHLSFVPGWNAVQLRRLVRALTGSSEPLVLIGDLNMATAQATRLTRMRSIATARTFPAPAPTRQIDHVLARGPIAARGPAEAPPLPVSDHRALVVPCGPA